MARGEQALVGIWEGNAVGACLLLLQGQKYRATFGLKK